MKIDEDTIGVMKTFADDHWERLIEHAKEAYSYPFPTMQGGKQATPKQQQEYWKAVQFQQNGLARIAQTVMQLARMRSGVIGQRMGTEEEKADLALILGEARDALGFDPAQYKKAKNIPTTQFTLIKKDDITKRTTR